MIDISDQFSVVHDFHCNKIVATLFYIFTTMKSQVQIAIFCSVLQEFHCPQNQDPFSGNPKVQMVGSNTTHISDSLILCSYNLCVLSVSIIQHIYCIPVRHPITLLRYMWMFPLWKRTCDYYELCGLLLFFSFILSKTSL